jgi:branched-chain amino acid transport system permease protein
MVAGTSALPGQFVAAPTTSVPGSHLVAFLAMAAFFAAGPFFIYNVFLMKVLCFALFACAFNLLIGFGGLVSFGHAAFLATAGYVTGHAMKAWGLPPELAIVLGTAGSALLGLAIGWLAIRRSGIYFAMITLALAQMLYFFFLQAKFTGGEDGLHIPSRGRFLGLVDLNHDWNLYYVVLTIFLLAFLFIYRIIHSPFGQILKAIRENEPRSTSLGYRVDQYKLLAFVLSAGLAGLAGSVKSIVFKLASLTDANWPMSGEVILMTLLGGMGTIFGPVLGAGIVVALQNYLADLGSWVTIIQGAIFIVCVLAFRRGIVGELAHLIKKPL